jgi:hypothetical protein
VGLDLVLLGFYEWVWEGVVWERRERDVSRFPVSLESWSFFRDVHWIWIYFSSRSLVGFFTVY